MWYMVIVAALASALGRRMAGGLLSHWVGVDLGDLPVRILWGVILAVCAYIVGLQWQYALALIPLVWVDTTVGYFGSMSAGNQQGRSHAVDYALLTLHGLSGVLSPAIGAFLLHLNPVWLIASGLLCAPCYALAWVWPWEIPILGCLQRDPPPTAELLWGACVGAGVVLTIIA